MLKNALIVWVFLLFGTDAQDSIQIIADEGTTMIGAPEADVKEINIPHNHTIGTPVGEIAVSGLESAWVRLEHASSATIPIHMWRYDMRSTQWNKLNVLGTELLFEVGWHESSIDMQDGLMVVTSAPLKTTGEWHAFFFRRNEVTLEYALEDHISGVDSNFAMARRVVIVGSNNVYLGGNNTVTQYVNSGTGVWNKLSVDLVRTDSFNDLHDFCSLSDDRVLLVHTQPTNGLSLYRRSLGSYELRDIYTDFSKVGTTDLACNNQLAIVSDEDAGDYGVVNIFNVSENNIQLITHRGPDLFPQADMKYGHSVSVVNNAVAVAGQRGGIVSVYRVVQNEVSVDYYLIDPDADIRLDGEIVEFGSSVSIGSDGHTLGVLTALWEPSAGNVTTSIYLYRDETLTVSPTKSPSVSPSVSPTGAPTISSPTVSPTFSPTDSPSKSPTTSSPTRSPTSPTIFFDPLEVYKVPTLDNLEVFAISTGFSVVIIAVQTWGIIVGMSILGVN
jgi:hypothetical protein